jgi:class 3 adenylate cyclase
LCNCVAQGDIFLFVNTIAEIVHSEVFRCQGAANKNIGEAFLMAWRLPKDFNEADLHLIVTCMSLVFTVFSRYLVLFLLTHTHLATSPLICFISDGADSVDVECLPAARRQAIHQARLLADKV